MENTPRRIFTLLLCLSLCLILGSGAFAEGTGTYEVRFFNEKNYDLAGLTVFDAGGNELAPAETDDGFVYLLTPGAYSYAYHDDRGIFVDVAETDFAVADAGQEIPVALKAVCEDFYFSGVIANPIYPGEDVESEILAAMPSREEVVDSLVRELLEDSALSIGDDEVFSASYGTNAAALQIRNDMVARTGSDKLSFSSSVSWSNEDFNDTFYDVLLRAIAHTCDHHEGDTLKETLKAAGYSASGTYSGGKYKYEITFNFTYRTNAQQEQATAEAVENLVSSLGLQGKSDYEKVSAIHEWLYQNVNYDFDNTLPEIRHTDYSALINRLAVCQGFATAYYRLCLAAGIDSRYVSSTVFNHGWNIIRLDGSYYESDVTWDSNWREGGSTDLPHYFLRGSEWWLVNHTDPTDASYSTIGDEFHHDSYTLIDPNLGLAIRTLQGQYADFDNYPLSAEDYVPAASGLAVNAVNFPDSVFRAYVSENIDTDGNGYLDDTEIAAVTQINVRGKNEEGAQRISTLKGIEYFPSLVILDCAGNALEELDVSQNTALECLTCGIMDNDGNVFGNQLSNLDVSKNTALGLLYCTHNQITTLDVSGNPELILLYCYNNGMTQLNITGCTKLLELSCGNNQLTSLNVSSNTALANLYCYNNDLRTLTVRNHPSLTSLACYMNPSLGTLDLSGCANLSYLYCQNCGLRNLNVTGCTRLTQVGCANNSLSTLDFSTCENLRDLGCQDNVLVDLNLTGCSQLSGLGCRDNQLAALDLSSCVNLQGLICNGNPMTSVDLTSCPDLVCAFCIAQPVEQDGDTTYFDNTNTLICDSTLRLLVSGLLELPADLAVIEDEAFAGGVFTYVKLPAGVTNVGWHAFAGCPNLTYIFVPSPDTAIDPSAFEGSNNVNVITPAA